MGSTEKERYKRLLLDPRWAERREEIISRDERKCRRCGGEDRLNVHHLRYPKSGIPWESGDEMLLTLCKECHEGESSDRTAEERELLDELAKICPYAEDIRAIRTSIRSWIQALPSPSDKDGPKLAGCIDRSRSEMGDEEHDFFASVWRGNALR